MSTPQKDPLVTIAIPTFNRLGWLKRCLFSAFSQTYPCLEVLVSDNASTDGTEKYLASISDPRLCVMRQASNIGPLPNCNACLSAANGEYIVFVPDDDSIAPHFLDSCIALVKTQPRIPVVIALANTREIVADGSSIIRPAVKSRLLDTGILDGTDILLEFLKQHISVQLCTALMRTEYLQMRGGFRADLPYAADMAAWAPLLLIGKAGFVNEDCGSFTSHSASQTTRNSVEIKLRDHKEVIESLVAIAKAKVGRDSAKRVEFVKEALVNINNNITGQLVHSRQLGRRSTDILAMVWRYRRDILVRGLTTKKNCRWLILLIVLILLPPRLRGPLRQLKSRICGPSQDSPESQRIASSRGDV
jgi:glycosyltransferase involved in cell wall biosynthesis